jgi:ADP-heptose:LPS heptosyltransferase
MDRILIIKLGAFGDVIQAEGALRDIRAHHPNAVIDILTRRAFAPLLARCPWVDCVRIDEHAPRWRVDRMLALRRVLRAEQFTRVYDLQGSSRSASYFRWMLPDVPWSGLKPGMAFPHLHPHPKTLHGRERLAVQLQAAGVPARWARTPDLSWMAEPADALLAAAGLARKPFALLIPGSSARHPTKRWGGFAALAEKLATAGLAVVTVPGPDEMALCAELPALSLLDVEGKALSLFALAGVAQRAALVVGNDTGPTHLAAYLGRPGLALMGGGTKSAAQVGLDLGAFTMLDAGPLHQLTVETVWQRLLPMLPPR